MNKRRTKVKGEVDGNVKRVARAGESEAWVWRRERNGTKENKGVEAGRGRWKQRKGGGRGGDERQRAAKVKESKG